jgi:predicted ATPase/DNA-binding XRE family transcriptional regulator
MVTAREPTFTQLLRQHRKASGISQEELARRALVSRRAISDLECGKSQTPREATLTLLADALDLNGAERVQFQAAARQGRRQPLPPTLDRHAHNLPIQPTPLLGRSREVSEVSRLLRDEDAWLVTVTGPPGVGKTRLSLQVAAELTSATDLFPDGVWLVRLSRLGDPALVLASFAHEFGLRDSGARPITQLLWDYLEARHMLLVMDNFEHVVAAAGDLSELRQHAPGVRLLVTSRTPLRLRGEREYALAPLPVPAQVTPGAALRPEQVGAYASVRLFSERARAAVADFAVTAATAPALAGICARLDGLPLALELAAARVKVLPVDTLLTRLERALPLLSGGPRDLDERQQTMRATLAWSDELLRADERALFRRLAVFAGAAPLAWIEDVCLAPEGAAPLNLDALSGLEALLNQSLIQRRDGPNGQGGEGQPRYSMLHVVREYALEQLAASGEADALRRAHALACLRLGEQYGPFTAFGHPTWLDRMGTERDNLRGAMTWALEHGEPELGLRLAIGEAQYDVVRGDARECDSWLTRMLRLDELSPDTSGEAATEAHDRHLARRNALVWATDYALMVGDRDRFDKLLDEREALARAAGDKVHATLALLDRTQMAILDNRATKDSYAALCTVITDIQRGEEDALKAFVLSWIGFDLICLPESVPAYLAEALAVTKEGISLAQRCGDRYSEFRGSELLAYLYTRGNDMQAARATIAHALEVIATFHYEGVMEISLGSLAAMAAHEGRLIRVARLAGAQVPLQEGRGAIRSGILDMPPILDAYTTLGPEAWARHFAEGQALSRAEVIAEAWREARGEPEA